MPLYFEEVFYCRKQPRPETENLSEQEPKRMSAFNELLENVRFCDLFQYLDTISVSLDIVKNSSHFFEIMHNSTYGKAFESACNFEYDSKLGVHTIESPNWFKPERFHCLASWVAAILEENLWANYNY